jgi:hypothetical protein
MIGELQQPVTSLRDGDVPPHDTDVAVSAVVQLADALDRLIARVERDCNVEASEGVPPREPAWAQVVDHLAAYAELCREVLDAPEVAAALAEDPDW